MENLTLMELRAAIDKSDWNRCDNLLHLLTKKLGKNKAQCLAVKHLRAFLPSFESAYPQLNWPRSFLDIVEKQGFMEVTQPFPELAISYTDPNINGFLSALELLDEATIPDTAPVLSLDLLADIVVSSINLRRREFWAGNFPEDAKIAHRSAIGEGGLPYLQSKYLYEPIVQEHTKSLWTELVVEAENLLNSE